MLLSPTLRGAAVALSLFAALPVLAQPAPDATTRAKELFATAQKLYKVGRYAEAIARFEEARAVKPHPILFFNIARCHEQLGQTGQALRAYRDYLRLLPQAADRDAVREAMAVLERRLRDSGVQQLLVLAQPESARVSVDGKELGSAPASIELIAGPHTLVVSAEGYEKLERTFTHELDRPSEQSVTLQRTKAEDAPTKSALAPAEPPPAPAVGKTVELVPAPKKGRVFTWVAAGTAVAAAGVGVGLGVASSSASASLRNATTPLDGRTAQRLANESVTLGTGANVSYGLAGAALVTALVLFFVEAP